ncbi:MAG: helix-hairpin-helix domain-containing protein [Candidatus Fervidibacter sp.]|uniref:helix-hairpin-helix domain-containing protein n=2 Tax=Candidatus Fervidibacter sp. TaxID=3100871 RepID=UPI00404B20B9
MSNQFPAGHARRIARYKSGFALILVLGVMVLLAILAAGIAFSVRSEINIAGEFSDRIRARYLAYAGLQRALLELSMDNPGVDSYVETWQRLRSDDEVLDFGDGIFIVHVTDEAGKLNINTADRDTLVAFFTQITGDSAQAEEITDAVIDWRDADDEPELLGAESDYYLNLEQPYRAKNAPFDSPFELLLVRGITRDIFYGDAELGIPPLTELITTYSAIPNVDERGLPRVNINTATREQLLEALGDILTEQEVDAILRYRDGTQQQGASVGQPTQMTPPTGGQPGAVRPPAVRPGSGQQPGFERPTQFGTQQPGFQRPQQPSQTRPTQPGTQQPSFQRPQQPSQTRPTQPGTQQPSFQRPQQPSQNRPSQPSSQRPSQTRPQFPSTGSSSFSTPSRGVPSEAVQQQQTGSTRPGASEPSGTGQRPLSGQTSQQQRRQIRSPLDLRRILSTEKLIAIWERITLTDEPVLYGLVNINTAPPEVLTAILPDNPAAVEEILAYREQNGGFASVGELLNIATLTQRELQQLISRVCVKSGTFRIRAAGIIGNQRVVHLMDTIVERQIVQSADSTTITDQPTFTVQFVVRRWKER